MLVSVAVTEQRGPVAAQIDGLTVVLVALSVAVFALFIYILVRGLLRDSSRDGEGAGRRLVIWGGVVLPAVVVSAVFALTLGVMRNQAISADVVPTVIEVTGHQWWWEVRYPEQGVVTANEIHVPAGIPFELRLTSADVVHSFWVPALGGKIDLLPERINTLVLQADQPGSYRGACAEFCGLQHARMRLLVVATSADEHERWLADQRAEADVGGEGLEVFLRARCGDCHTVRGSGADGDSGPDLTHVASRTALAAGTLANTRSGLMEWVADPQRLKQGVDMPDVELSPGDLETLVDFLESLE